MIAVEILKNDKNVKKLLLKQAKTVHLHYPPNIEAIKNPFEYFTNQLIYNSKLKLNFTNINLNNSLIKVFLNLSTAGK